MGTIHVQAVSERVSAMRAAQLSYTDAPIHVEIVQASDLQKAPAAPTGDLGFLGDAYSERREGTPRPWHPYCMQNASLTSSYWVPLHKELGNASRQTCAETLRRIANAGERRSKRARRGEAEVKVSSSNTLWDFKLRLVEALSIHPKNADVHIRLCGTWQKLANDDASLAGEGQLLSSICVNPGHSLLSMATCLLSCRGSWAQAARCSDSSDGEELESLAMKSTDSLKL